MSDQWVDGPIPRRPWWASIGGAALLLIGGFGVAFAIGFNLWLVYVVLESFWEEPYRADSIVFVLAAAAYLSAFGLYADRTVALTAALCMALFAITCLVVSALIVGDGAILMILMGYSFVHFVTYCFVGCLARGARLTDDAFWRDRHLEHGECPYCLYPTRGLRENRCPECGNTWSEQDG